MAVPIAIVDGRRDRFRVVEIFAQMAELVDVLVSGTSVSNGVQVRVLFWAQKQSLTY
jgi:hypothetical protein